MTLTKKVEDSKAPKVQKAYTGIDVDIRRQGKMMILPNDPAPMDYDTAIAVLQQKKADEETRVNVHEAIVEAFPWDGAIAFFKAMCDSYGWGQAVKTPPKHIFDSGQEPTSITVEIGFNQRTEILWGAFKIPGIEGQLETSTTREGDRLVFCLKGWVKKKHLSKVRELAELTRKYVRESSCYRGKAFQLQVDDDGDLDWNSPPKFLDTSIIKPEELIFSKVLEEQIYTLVFTPVMHTDFCRQNGIPLGRGILLEGPFGTGKSLTAAIASRLCEENNWTFITISEATALEAALQFARIYQPSMVFAEDIDRVVAGGRNVEMDRILNTIDGVTGKGSEVITILTTNEADKINPAMLRPGRLDAVISLRAPDAEAVERLIRLYARGLLSSGASLISAGEKLAGEIPATIREVVERAKLFAIHRTGSPDITLTGEDLVGAADSMRQHLELLNRERQAILTPEAALGTAFGDLLEHKQGKVCPINQARR
jgi:transitional endoplasmic reticulum ATPase